MLKLLMGVVGLTLPGLHQVKRLGQTRSWMKVFFFFFLMAGPYFWTLDFFFNIIWVWLKFGLPVWLGLFFLLDGSS